MNQDLILDRLTNNIIDYTIKTREKVYNNVREEMVNYYWNVGRMIVEEEQGGDITPEYGRKLYLELAKRLTKKMGKGFSRSNLFNMRNFYIIYPIVQTYGQLTWSHFCELIGIKDENEDKEEYIIDFSKLKEQNNETVAWIKVNNTNIDYPIVKADNNDFYLNHSFDKNKNSAGWIFADYRNKFDNTDKNLVIYGHNMRDDSMFGSLKWVINEDWYNNEDNKYITLITENETQVYEVFSVYQIEKEDYYIQTEFSDDNNFEQFVNTIKKRSIKEFNTDVSKDDNILTLSTCANNNKYRVVLHAKKI